jgi:hypothetical protein
MTTGLSMEPEMMEEPWHGAHPTFRKSYHFNIDEKTL